MAKKLIWYILGIILFIFILSLINKSGESAAKKLWKLSYILTLYLPMLILNT